VRRELRCHYIIMQKVLVRSEKSPRAGSSPARGLVWVFLEVLFQAALRHAGELLAHRAGTSLTHTVHGAQILKHSKLSRKEISDLLNSALKEEPKAEEQAAVKTRKDGFNWTLASLIALTVLIMQLFYLALL